MKYFVSIENINYHRWQVELLIESFKRLSIEEDLIISIASNTDLPIKKFTRNLTLHKNKFSHENHGKKIGYLPANKLLGFYLAVKGGLISKEFTILHPDMVLVQVVPPTTLDYSMSLEGNLKNTIVGREIGKDLIEELGQRVQLNLDHGQNNSLEASLTEFINRNSLRVSATNIENNLINSFPGAAVIHYRNGLPPLFHKKNHIYTPPDYFVTDDPYDAICKSGVTEPMDYLIQVVDSYRKNN